ncbi:hypothetical protein [Novosphingobium sp. 18050]|nr:hypothetical protein [Novosphingobium sp. 18050]
MPRNLPPLVWPSILVIIAMVGCGINIAIGDDIGHGAGMDVWLAGAANPWQLFINLDLMTGLLLAVTWIGWRERHNGLAMQVAWVLLTLWWGNLIVALYVLIALQEARGDGARFLSGVAQGAWADTLGGTLRIIFGLLALAAATTMTLGVLRVAPAFLPVLGYVSGLGSLAFFLGLLALRRPATFPQSPQARTRP